MKSIKATLEQNGSTCIVGSLSYKEGMGGWIFISGLQSGSSRKGHELNTLKKSVRRKHGKNIQFSDELGAAA